GHSLCFQKTLTTLIILYQEKMAKNVKIYTTSTCPYCHMLKSFLREKNIQFEDIDVGSSAEKAREMIKKSGQMGVPVVDIDGKIIIGFDKEAISKELGI
ncbi:MAG: glutaredoxin family protein, partial [Endomicrobiia bacterium]